jgi:hypothetical protein
MMPSNLLTGKKNDVHMPFLRLKKLKATADTTSHRYCLSDYRVIKHARHNMASDGLFSTIDFIADRIISDG